MGAEGAKLAAREHNNVRSKLISQAKGRSKGLDMGISVDAGSRCRLNRSI